MGFTRLRCRDRPGLARGLAIDAAAPVLWCSGAICVRRTAVVPATRGLRPHRALLWKTLVVTALVLGRVYCRLQHRARRGRGRGGAARHAARPAAQGLRGDRLGSAHAVRGPLRHRRCRRAGGVRPAHLRAGWLRLASTTLTGLSATTAAHFECHQQRAGRDAVHQNRSAAA